MEVINKVIEAEVDKIVEVMEVIDKVVEVMEVISNRKVV